MQARQRGRPPHPDRLTPAEWDVLNDVRHGMSNRIIARQRQTSLDAVKFHLENIRAKLGVEGRQALRHWPGAPCDSAKSRRSQPAMPEPLALGHLGQVSRTVSDIERSVAFYRDIVRLPHLFTAGQLAFFDCAGTRLMLDALPEAQGHGSSALYFDVPDIDAAHAELTARGAEFAGAPHMINRAEDGTELWMAFFNDPDDNVVAIMSEVAPG
ncbi:MAG TPA: VOC family protein [Tepidiformaceae bacterium]|nr:VOC family protein [Tepidiformaceae bacterium]